MSEMVPETIEPYSRTFLAQHGLEDMADETIEAHGGTYTVAQALDGGCDPFANMVTALAENLKDVPDYQDILRNSIRAAGASATTPLSETAKKK